MSKINSEVCNTNDELQKLEENRQGQALGVVYIFFSLKKYFLGSKQRTQTVVIHKSRSRSWISNFD